MSGKNLCAVVHGVQDVRLEERPIPKPKNGEVQINIRSVGICGSDANLYRLGRIGPYNLTNPIIIGHEPCGIVTQVGPGVTDLVVGDRVAVSPHYGCGTCPPCEEGRFNICAGDVTMMATPPTDGCLANYIAWPARFCYKMPAQMTWEQGALVQPMALALHGCQRAGVKPGHRVMICGAGPLGMMQVVVAQAFGATRICVTDISEERLQFIAKVTGCFTTRADEGTPRDVADRVVSLLEGNIDVSMECSGAGSAVSTAIYATKPGGCILLAGLGAPEVQIPLVIAICKEMDIRSMHRFTTTYPAAIDLISSGKIDIKPLVTHTFDLSNIVEGLETMNRRAQGKVVIKCSDD